MKFRFFIVSILLMFASCEKSTSDVFTVLAANDVGLGVPQPGDWLVEHKEKGQTFEDYVSKKPLKVSDTKNVIYIQPIGSFTKKENEIVDNTVVYLSLFYQLKVEKLPVINDSIIPVDKRRLREDNSEQLDASFIINTVIPKIKPKNALVVMAITSKDLYPQPSWNYVFGLANYNKGTGVTSLYRYEPNVEDNTLCLARTIKTSAHEIGHMFQLQHCITGVCLMNGVNNLEEDDRKPNSLCSVCLHKLSWHFGFDDEKRLKEIITFLKEHRLTTDAALVDKQYQIIKKYKQNH